MESAKSGNDIQESPTSNLRSILKNNSCRVKKDNSMLKKSNSMLKKSKTLASKKSVSFPDKFKKPLCIIIEVDPIIYLDTKDEIKKNLRRKDVLA